MEFTIIDKYAKSSDGTHTLYGKAYIPIGLPKATFQIIHGMSEYMTLYGDFMAFLATRGFVVFGHDQLGHGKTALGESEFGFFGEKDGDKTLVDDAAVFSREFIKTYHRIPHFVFGHSMGSFVARIMAEKYTECVDRLILCGTGGPQPLAPIGMAYTDLKGKLHGKNFRSETALNIMLTFYNHSFRDEKDSHAWLSRDKDRITNFNNDTKSNYTFCVQALNDIVKLSTDCNSDEWFEHYRKDLPTLLISGNLDPVGSNGHGVLEVYKRLHNSGVLDISLKLYRGCRHELLNELNRGEVINDIINWSDRRIPTLINLSYSDY